VRLARRADRTVKINIAFALSAILIMAITTVVGSWLKHPLPLWAGVLGHEGGTLLVVGHSLLLLSFRAVATPSVVVTPPLLPR
jgi:cation transport ATPase